MKQFLNIKSNSNATHSLFIFLQVSAIASLFSGIAIAESLDSPAVDMNDSLSPCSIHIQQSSINENGYVLDFGQKLFQDLQSKKYEPVAYAEDAKYLFDFEYAHRFAGHFDHADIKFVITDQETGATYYSDPQTVSCTMQMCQITDFRNTVLKNFKNMAKNLKSCQ